MVQYLNFKNLRKNVLTASVYGFQKLPKNLQVALVYEFEKSTKKCAIALSLVLRWILKITKKLANGSSMLISKIYEKTWKWLQYVKFKNLPKNLQMASVCGFQNLPKNLQMAPVCEF